MEVTINEILQILIMCKSAKPTTIVEDCLLKNIEKLIFPTSHELDNELSNTKICKINYTYIEVE